MSIPYLDIIVIALIAGFILLRLRSILGQDAGFDNHADKQDNDPSASSKGTAHRDGKASQKIFPLNPNDLAAVLNLEKEEDADKALTDELDDSLQDALKEIKEMDAEFNLGQFIEGAKGAFEMVLKAFHENDEETLRHLLADDIEQMFVSEAEAREKSATKSDTTLVSFPSADVIDVELKKKIASITLSFTTEQIQVERDDEGKIISGNPSHVQRVEDEWTFERDLTSRSPNWIVTAT